MHEKPPRRIVEISSTPARSILRFVGALPVELLRDDPLREYWRWRCCRRLADSHGHRVEEEEEGARRPHWRHGCTGLRPLRDAALASQRCEDSGNLKLRGATRFSCSLHTAPASINALRRASGAWGEVSYRRPSRACRQGSPDLACAAAVSTQRTVAHRKRGQGEWAKRRSCGRP